jgi:hypothetical protein
MPDVNRFSLRRRNGIPSRLSLLLLPFVAFICVGANAQSSCSGAPLQIDETIGELHVKSAPLEKQGFPWEYENNHELLIVLAKEKIQGLAVLQVDVNAAGTVTAVEEISGPHALTSVFADETKRLSFVPFKQNGQPVCGRFTSRWVTRNYAHETGPEFAGVDQFYSLFKKCRTLSASGTRPAGMVGSCEPAAEAAEPLRADYFGQDKRAAYVLCATALMRDNRPKEALPYAEKAVATADLGFDDVSGKAAAYGVRGQARALTGDLRGANEDLLKAEELERATFDVPRKPEQKAFNTHALQSMLGFHAEVLTALGNKPAAEKLRDEAKKL